MSAGFEEETYSTMFTSLKHPVRRKILRILLEKPRSFSEMLETLGISSSHLTYHLENLGELVSKMEDGRYKLSVFGEAAVGTMSKVEEVPKVAEAKRPSSLSMKWKTLFTVIMVGLVVLAGVNYVQIRHLEELNRNNESQIRDLSQTLSSMVYSLYYEDIQAAVQRWIGVHGNPHEDFVVKPCYINTGDVAAWIDPAGYLEFVFGGHYGPLHSPGVYWDISPYAHWVRPPGVIAVWVQLYNRSSGLWFPKTDVFSRRISEFAFYLINSSSHGVVGITGNYASMLLRDFRDNSLPNILPDIIGTSDYLLYPRSWGMVDGGSWRRMEWIMLQSDEPTGEDCVRDWCPAYDLELLVDWKTETASIGTLNPK